MPRNQQNFTTIKQKAVHDIEGSKEKSCLWFGLGYEIKSDFTNFSLKISNELKRPQEKLVLQMAYGILAAKKLHLSEIARSLKETTKLKKTIDRATSSPKYICSDGGLKNISGLRNSILNRRI